MVHAELTVAAIVMRNQRFLVVEEIAAGKRVLNQPAGHVEQGETIFDAVVRETREETAWGFTPTGLVGIYYWPHGDGRVTMRFAFCGEVDDHAPDQLLDDGVLAAHWVSAQELAAQANLRSPLVMRAIEDFTHSTPLPMDYLHHVRG